MGQRVNLDGSPLPTRFYASGFRMAAQVVTSPAAAAGLAVGFALAAKEILAATPAVEATAAGLCVLEHLAWPVGVFLFNKMNFSYRNKVAPKMDAVIETGPAAKDEDSGMRKAAVKKFREIAGLQAGFGVAIAAVVASNGGTHAAAEATVVWSLLLQAGWNRYAAHQIGKGDWHIAERPAENRGETKSALKLEK